MSVKRYHPAPCFCLGCRALDRDGVVKEPDPGPEPEKPAPKRGAKPKRK